MESAVEVFKYYDPQLKIVIEDWRMHFAHHFLPLFQNSIMWPFKPIIIKQFYF